MQPLNAFDAVAPAFTRTHQILFRPFRLSRLGRSWKLAVSQYIGLIGALFIPFPLLLLLIPMGSLNLPVARAAIFVVAAVVTLVLFVFFYLGVRMQFVNFEMIVTRAQFIAPMWRRYGARVWPVIAAKTILGTVLPLAMLPVFWTTGKALFQIMAHMPRIEPALAPGQATGQLPDLQVFQAFFAQLVGLYAIMFCAIILLKLFSSTFEDFVMPFYILEPISLTEAIRRGFKVLANDPLQCILYLLLKLVLSIIGFIMQYISSLVLLIPIGILGLIAAGIGIAAGTVLHGMGSVGHLLLFAFGILLYLLFLAVLLWYQLGTLGYLATLVEAYGIFFLGGRYPLLGNLLEPSTDAPFTPPPLFPSPEESDDEDDGPPIPMDPALAFVSHPRRIYDSLFVIP